MGSRADALNHLFQPATQRFRVTKTLASNVTGVAEGSCETYDTDYCGLFEIDHGRINAVRAYLDSDHARQILFPAEVKEHS